MLLNKCVKIRELFDVQNAWLAPLFEGVEYPWELLPLIEGYIKELIRNGMKGYTLVGNDVLVGEDVKIAPTAVITGPAVIGRGSEVRAGAFIRGMALVGEGCVIGNSTEVKNSILLDGAQAPHYNYVGDSILGCRAHLGAGAICSNLKAGGGSVTVHGEEEYPTGLRKLGAILGDGADVGCGCVLNPGTVLGKGARVYPLLALRGVYPSECIVKDAKIVVRKI